MPALVPFNKHKHTYLLVFLIGGTIYLSIIAYLGVKFKNSTIQPQQRILKSYYVQQHRATVNVTGIQKVYKSNSFSFLLPIHYQQDPHNTQRVYVPLSSSAIKSTNNALQEADIQTAVVPAGSDEVSETIKNAYQKQTVTVDGIQATEAIHFSGNNNSIYYATVVIEKGTKDYVITFRTATNDHAMQLIPEFSQILQSVRLM